MKPSLWILACAAVAASGCASGPREAELRAVEQARAIAQRVPGMIDAWETAGRPTFLDGAHFPSDVFAPIADDADVRDARIGWGVDDPQFVAYHAMPCHDFGGRLLRERRPERVVDGVAIHTWGNERSDAQIIAVATAPGGQAVIVQHDGAEEPRRWELDESKVTPHLRDLPVDQALFERVVAEVLRATIDHGERARRLRAILPDPSLRAIEVSTMNVGEMLAAEGSQSDGVLVSGWFVRGRWDSDLPTAGHGLRVGRIGSWFYSVEGVDGRADVLRAHTWRRVGDELVRVGIVKAIGATGA